MRDNHRNKKNSGFLIDACTNLRTLKKEYDMKMIAISCIGLMTHGMICGMNLEGHQSDVLRSMTLGLICNRAPMTTENWKKLTTLLREEQRQLHLAFTHKKNDKSPLIQGLQLTIDFDSDEDDAECDELKALIDEIKGQRTITLEDRKLIKKEFEKEQAKFAPYFAQPKMNPANFIEQRWTWQDQDAEDKKNN